MHRASEIRSADFDFLGTMGVAWLIQIELIKSSTPRKTRLKPRIPNDVFCGVSSIHISVMIYDPIVTKRAPDMCVHIQTWGQGHTHDVVD